MGNTDLLQRMREKKKERERVCVCGTQSMTAGIPLNSSDSRVSKYASVCVQCMSRGLSYTTSRLLRGEGCVCLEYLP